MSGQRLMDRVQVQDHGLPGHAVDKRRVWDYPVCSALSAEYSEEHPKVGAHRTSFTGTVAEGLPGGSPRITWTLFHMHLMP